MRYVRTDSFKADYKRLSDDHRARFRTAAVVFNEACDRFAEAGTPFPQSLRVKAMQGAEGIFEMTWSFTGPDGRATWEWGVVELTQLDGSTLHERAVVWRRIGTHRVFDRP